MCDKLGTINVIQEKQPGGTLEKNTIGGTAWIFFKSMDDI